MQADRLSPPPSPVGKLKCWIRPSILQFDYEPPSTPPLQQGRNVGDRRQEHIISVFNKNKCDVKFELWSTSPELFEAKSSSGTLQAGTYVDIPVAMNPQPQKQQDVIGQETKKSSGGPTLEAAILVKFRNEQGQEASKTITVQVKRKGILKNYTKEVTKEIILDNGEKVGNTKSATAKDKVVAKGEQVVGDGEEIVVKEEQVEEEKSLSVIDETEANHKKSNREQMTATVSQLIGTVLQKDFYIRYAPVLFGASIVLIMMFSHDPMDYETRKLLIASYLVGLAAMFVQTKFDEQEQRERIQQQHQQQQQRAREIRHR